MLKYDVVVVGGGPAGYVAALRSAQLGFNTACIEREPQLGGTCLRVGCIPSKALLESSLCYHLAQHEWAHHGVRVNEVVLDLPTMMKRKEQVVNTLARGISGLFRKHRVQQLTGTARLLPQQRILIQQGESTQEVQARHVIIATGSRPAWIPTIPRDLPQVGTSTEALSYPQVPRHLVVIGAGYIGLELGCVWSRLGAKVTVLEALSRILPGTDAELAQEAQQVFQKQGLEFRLGVKVVGVRPIAHSASEVVVETEGCESVTCDRVLVAVGRVPNTEGLSADEVGLQRDDRGRIVVDAQFRTNLPGVYAIGDVIAGPMLAHKAEEEGVACVEGIAGHPVHVNYQAIPAVCYTEPEIASVGPTEEQLQQQGVPYRKGVFPFAANGRARSLGHIEGRVKVLAHRDTDRLLGVHILGPRAGDLIAEAVAALEFGASAEDLGLVCHAHPTLSEALKEAAWAVSGRAIHI
ncbi:MAG: dihydrolipoyl dehydrogenase [Planctomycetaceae bacterium]|nr:MAG: dihydrolipoyl dehydrogenase [Planctomycetaceae bacterium]